MVRYASRRGDEFYISLFKNSKVNNISRVPDGKVFTVAFELDGQELLG
ncbi:MAG: VOC family protein [Anaerolineales bacterium]|nr:VOC family protein [Anaerolineales bacterium]